MIAFFEQCQATDKAAGVLQKISKDKQPKERKMAQLCVARSRKSSYCQCCSRKYLDYHWSIQRDRNDWRSNYRHWDVGVMIALNATTRMWGATSPLARGMIASAIASRKRVTRPCIMTSPLCQAPAICPEKGVNLVPDYLRALGLALDLAQAAGATTTIMLTKMTASRVQHPSMGIHPSTGTHSPPKVTTADAFITWTKAIQSLPHSPLQRQRRSVTRNRELRQQRKVVSLCMSLFKIGNQTSWLIVMLK